ncbi:MAG: hypothetical protein R6U37_02260 [Dehalococcoidia bacterium]
MMWRFRACPKCGGDVYIDQDPITGEWQQVCLQCSHRRYVSEEADEKGLTDPGEPVGAVTGGDKEWQRYWEST